MSFLSLLKQTCSVQRKTHTVNDYGYPEISWSTEYSSLPCNVQTRRRDLNITLAGQEEAALARGFLPYEWNGSRVVVKADDKVIINNEADVRVGSFVVTHVPIDTVGRRHHLQVDLRLIDEETHGGS